MSFQEYCEDCPEQTRTVRRDASFKDNSALPAQVALRTGDLIYDGLKNGFRVSGPMMYVQAEPACFALHADHSQVDAGRILLTQKGLCALLLKTFSACVTSAHSLLQPTIKVPPLQPFRHSVCLCASMQAGTLQQLMMSLCDAGG